MPAPPRAGRRTARWRRAAWTRRSFIPSVAAQLVPDGLDVQSQLPRGLRLVVAGTLQRLQDEPPLCFLERGADGERQRGRTAGDERLKVRRQVPGLDPS